MSNMYSLLNYIGATSKDIYDSSSVHTHNYPSYVQGNLPSLETGLRGLSDDEKRLIGISTISAVTRLALEFKMEEVIRQHLLQDSGTETCFPGDKTDNLNAITALGFCRANCRGCHRIQSCRPGLSCSKKCLQ